MARLGSRTVIYAPGGDGGQYRWQDGWPRIVLFRWPVPVPDDRPSDDRPDLDAVFLAHEIGHFLCDPESRRTEAVYLRWDQNPTAPITPEEAAAMLEEEHQAWELGEARLRALGWTEWAIFNRTRANSLATYEQALPRFVRGR